MDTVPDRSPVLVDATSRFAQRSEEARRALVLASLAAARSVIEAGLEGRIPLEEAVCTAGGFLRPAEQEVLKRALA